ncbi:FCD domain-containing protein [Streptomyces sp. NPDC047706]|uniref:FCD domain-containing protein n=1 Tax=Streptomyces sp. NPDC047706 TaxID=3365486 RepID=UPI00371423E4
MRRMPGEPRDRRVRREIVQLILAPRLPALQALDTAEIRHGDGGYARDRPDEPSPELTVDRHRAIISALRARDVEGAQRATAVHFRGGEDRPGEGASPRQRPRAVLVLSGVADEPRGGVVPPDAGRPRGGRRGRRGGGGRTRRGGVRLAPPRPSARTPRRAVPRASPAPYRSQAPAGAARRGLVRGERIPAACLTCLPDVFEPRGPHREPKQATRRRPAGTADGHGTGRRGTMAGEVRAWNGPLS